IPKTSIGKLQRLKLKQQFETGRFEQQVKQIDLLLENENTIPNWFYEKMWHPKASVVSAAQPTSGTTLIFVDALGLGEAFKKKWRSANGSAKCDCVMVTPGLEFAQLSDHSYQLDHCNPDHYRQLLEALTDCVITQIVHLWHYSEATTIDQIDALEVAQDVGLYSLLWLVQALAAVRTSADPTVRLQVVASQSQATKEGESIAYEKSPVLGVIKTLPKEIPWLDCRHLDLPIASLEENAVHILRELRVLQTECEVAIRGGQRLIPKLDLVNLTDAQPQGIPFKQGGVYLLSGGLGGVGVEIARYLLQHYQARLILVGRSLLPERAAWATHLEQSDAMAVRIRALMSLEALGEVRYEAVDICDGIALSALITQAEHHWQRELDGVIHLAGVAPERALLKETKKSLAATLRPKIIGAWVLHQLVKEKADCLFIHFSSVLSFFGGATVGGYAAANSFLDSFGHYQRSETPVQSYCFGSSTWAQVGVNQGYEGADIRRAQGQIAMSITQGMQSLLTGLNYGQQRLIFGLDGSKRNVQRYEIATTQLTQQLRAYVTLQDQASLDDRQPPTVVDQFGTLSECKLTAVSSLPLKVSGEVDFDQLATLSSGAGFVAPRTPMEHRLAEIWQSILEIPSVGIHDSFFDLGGTSLFAARLFLEIEQVFDRTLPLATLFQASTIEQLATRLSQADSDDDWSSLVPIRSQGHKRPLFLVHAGFGDVVGFQTLVQYIEPDRPFYGLRPVDLDGVREPLVTIEAMAAHYVAEILKVHPEGPYLLGGQCTGGIVAYEMAQQLKRQGHEVQLLAMLDTSFPTIKNYWMPRLRYYFHKPQYKRDRKDGWFYVFTVIYLWRKLGYATKYHSHRLGQLKTRDRIAYVKQYADKAIRTAMGKVLSKLSRKLPSEKPQQLAQAAPGSQLQSISRAGSDVCQPIPATPRPTQDAMVRNAVAKDRFFETFLRAQAAYTPEPYDGTIDFFLSTTNTYVAIAPSTSLKSFKKNVPVKDPANLLLGWDKLVGEGFKLHPFESRHEDMLSAPYIELLAQKLNQAICDRTDADSFVD
ncbi:MAG: KR domain-containing protein, partial [Cyanobacteria bacterium P01_D01_bin.44]